MKREIEKIQGFLRHAWDKRWWLLGIHVLAAAAALTAFHVLPPEYRSTTTIRVSPDSVINPLTQGLAVSSRTEALAGTLRWLINAMRGGPCRSAGAPPRMF